MLLKKQIKENIIKALYDSSNVLASIYDTSTQDLTLIFKSGTQYKYPNVSTSDYTRLEIAESQGAVFNSHIKKYEFEKLGKIDVNQIINETVKLKGLEDDALELAKRIGVVNSLKQLLVLNDAVPFEKEKFSTQLKILQDNIEKYNS